MKPTAKQKQVTNEIDRALRQGDFEYVPLNESKYRAWYSRLLSTLTLALGDEKIIYAQTDHVTDRDTATLSIFTKELLIRTEVVGIDGDHPDVATRLIPRSDIEALTVDASMPIDQSGSLAYGWPGNVQLTVKYRGFDEPFVFEGQGVESRNTEEFAAIVHLLHVLKTALAPDDPAPTHSS